MADVKQLITRLPQSTDKWIHYFLYIRDRGGDATPNYIEERVLSSVSPMDTGNNKKHIWTIARLIYPV